MNKQNEAALNTAMTVEYSSLENPKFKPGRRAWIEYRDLGVEAATNGAMRAEVMHIDQAESSKPTGWHYHTADLQFLMMVDGWVKIEFPDRGVVTLKTGESILIPGGVVHQELCSSEPMRLLEITVPAKMDTVPVAAPEARVEAGDYIGTDEPSQAS